MQFQNALEGVKKIYKAEILALIAAVVGIVAGIVALVGAANGAVGGAVGAGLLAIAVAVLFVIALIMNIAGLNKAKPDEENFKNALYALIVGIVASIAMGAAKEGSLLKDLGETVQRICSFLGTYYVCTAIINLAERLNDTEMAEKGRKARKMLMTVWIIGIVVSVLGVIFNAAGASTGIAVAVLVLALVASVVEIIAYILYLKLLSKARTMLES